MNTQNSGRSVKSLSGNGTDPPHMQSSLSPQGYGLYNSCLGAAGGGGDADSIVDSTSNASSPSPLKKQTISYNDYLTSHPQRNSSNVSAAMQDPYWNVTGNENLSKLAPKPTSTGDGIGGSYINTTTAPSFDSKSFGSFANGTNSIIDAKALEKSQQQYHQQEQQRQQYFRPGNNSAGRNKAAALLPLQNTKVEDVGMDRDREKDRLIDSLSNSDMITCLPGFKKRTTLNKPNASQLWNNGNSKLNNDVSRRLAQQDMNQNAILNSSGPISTVRGPAVPSSAYARQTPASLPSIPYYPKKGSSIDGAILPIGNVGPTSANGNSNTLNNSARTVINSNGYNPPASPITRAKVAIGRAQKEISRIDKFMENEADKRKPPGAWKNMGTPLFSEPQTKSAQRQQKAQYRMDLERQILATKMRKAEEERKERDANDHPLGPEYAHPALTYYNPPQKIVGGSDKGGTSSTATKTAALTKYIKEKYALDIPASGGGGSNTIAAYTPGYPQEIGVGGSTTALGRIAPLQQTKKEKALANLMKSRMHPGGTGNGEDQNHSNTSRSMPMNQLQTGGTPVYNGMMMQPGNSSRFSQQLHQQQQHGQQRSVPQQVKALVEQTNPNSFSQQHPEYISQHQHQQQHQFPYSPGTYAPPRPYAATAWPIPMYPAAAAAYHYPPQYYGAYGQPMYPSANHGSVNSEQVHPQHQNQPQLNYQSSTAVPLPRPPTRPSPSATLRSMLHDRHVDEENGDDIDDDPGIDFETLKEKAHKAQKIWQTSDELPDPGLRLAVYKVELRKQIDEDRKRKAERVAREKEEDERIERKIREFHDEEKRRLRIEQQTRAELEGYHKHKMEQQQRRKNEAYIVSKQSERMVKQTRPRSRSSLLAEKLASFSSPETGDFEDEFYDDDNGYDNSENGYETTLETKLERAHSVRKNSPPVPVVQKKLIENFLLDNCEQNVSTRPEICSEGQNFLFQLKSKLRSERDLVERRLQEKIESTHKNMNLLKYTM